MAGESAAGAARYVMLSIGRALVVTSLVLAAGFTVVAPSIMASLGRFGLLMAVCLLLALVYDLLMTPAVLAWLNPGGIDTDAAKADKDAF
jgi:predicted RND superfamily exporter protein